MELEEGDACPGCGAELEEVLKSSFVLNMVTGEDGEDRLDGSNQERPARCVLKCFSCGGEY